MGARTSWRGNFGKAQRVIVGLDLKPIRAKWNEVELNLGSKIPGKSVDRTLSGNTSLRADFGILRGILKLLSEALTQLGNGINGMAFGGVCDSGLCP